MAIACRAGESYEHIIAKKIHDLRESLWVVAAGQPDRRACHCLRRWMID